MTDNYSGIILRMMRQLEEEDNRPNGARGCDGCGRRVELAPYQRRITDVGSEIVNNCGDCRALATVKLEGDNF